MTAYFLVFLGGGLGAAARYTVNLASGRWLGTDFPFHTLFENVSGSLAMGLLAGYFALKSSAPQPLVLFLTTGILGGYTTFSAFSLDAVALWERQQYLIASGYVAGSVAASVAGLAIGLAVVRHLT